MPIEPRQARGFVVVGAVGIIDVTELTNLTRALQMQVIPDLQRQIRELGQTLELHRQRLVRLENHTSRRFAVALTNVAVGATPVPIVWDAPFPAQDYTAVCTFTGGDNALTVLRAGVVPFTKDENGLTVEVINTSAAPIASVGLDVIAVRP